MKATELRIGNYFDLYGTVGQMIPNDFKKWFNETWEAPAFNPIPLTEEWLLKFGFFKFNNEWVLKEPSSNPTEFAFSIWEDLTYNTGELTPPLKYVHQLQNLYFALTGEEL